MALTLTGTLHAAAIQPNGAWYEFSFFDVGTQARGCFPADPDNTALDCIPSSGTPTVFAPAPAWTFTVTTSYATLIVTDAFLHGDVFDVFDGGGLIFSTSSVPVDGTGCGDDPVPCLNDPSASHGIFHLGPGAHSITVTPTQIYDGGAGYFNVSEAPEPATVFVFGAGLLAITGKRIYRQRRSRG
jgi:hypothetical protein